MDTAYLEFLGGIDDAGLPEPLVNVGITILGPATADAPEGTAKVVRLVPTDRKEAEAWGRIVPQTRIVASQHPAVIGHLLGRGDWRLVDAPGGREAKDQTEDHRAARAAKSKSKE